MANVPLPGNEVSETNPSTRSDPFHQPRCPVCDDRSHSEEGHRYNKCRDSSAAELRRRPRRQRQGTEAHSRSEQPVAGRSVADLPRAIRSHGCAGPDADEAIARHHSDGRGNESDGRNRSRYDD